MLMLENSLEVLFWLIHRLDKCIIDFGKFMIIFFHGESIAGLDSMFEYGKTLDKVLEDLLVNIGDFVVAEWCFVKSSFYHAGRDADGGRVSRDILDDDRIGTDFGIFADGDIAEYLGSCTEYDICLLYTSPSPRDS